MEGYVEPFPIIENVIQKLVSLDFEDYIVSFVKNDSSQLRFSDNQFTIAKNWTSATLRIFGVKQQKTVSTEINNLTTDVINNTLENLEKLAIALPKNDNYLGISEGPFSYPTIEQLVDPNYDDFHSKAVDNVESAINSAIEVGAKRSAGVLYWRKIEELILSSKGATAQHSKTSYEFTIRSFVDSQTSGQGVSVGCLSNSINFEEAGKQAGEIAKLSEGGKEGKPGKYNVLLSPTVSADIIAATPRAANPFSVEIGFSWLKDKIGENIGPETVTVYDDALLPNGLDSKPFDDEGHPTGRNVLIEEGILKGLIHNTSTAKKANTVSTGNAGLLSPENSNIFFEPGDYTLDELMELSKGKPTLYITSNWYTRFTSYIDGIFSTIPRDGMFLIENGEITKPVRELRISDSMLNIFNNIKALGKDLTQIKWWEVYVPTFIPSILIEEVNITSATS